VARAFADLHRSVLVVVDVQPKFMAAIWEAERVMRRTEFLVRCAQALAGTIIATEQNPSRMGATADSLLPLLSEPAQAKMTFSCSGCELFQRHFVNATPMQVTLVGIETHICVSQTAHELLDLGHEVIIGIDAVSARTEDRHAIGLERLRAAGAVLAHTESIAYEWMRTAEHPNFRSVLEIVKQYA
jgi:nicotinamidase-related amidase